MSPEPTKLLLSVVAVTWVGGWGWVMFRYPEFFANVNRRLGFGRFASPRFIRFTRWMGVVEMVLAGFTAVNSIATWAFRKH